jgi:hypothetical protein
LTFLGQEASAVDAREEGNPFDTRPFDTTAGAGGAQAAVAPDPVAPATVIGAKQDGGFTPCAAAIAAAHRAGISGGGFKFESGQGLAIDLRLTSSCLANGGGGLLALIGFIMMVAGTTGVIVLGTFLLVGGLLIVFVYNKDRCAAWCFFDVGSEKDPAKAVSTPSPATGTGTPKSDVAPKRQVGDIAL